MKEIKDVEAMIWVPKKQLVCKDENLIVIKIIY